MNEEFREKLIAQIENAVRWAGAKDFDEGMAQARATFMFFLEGIEEIQTKQHLRRVLDAWPDPSLGTGKIILATAGYLPKLLTYGAGQLAKRLNSDAPIPKGGRPAIPQQTRAEIVSFIAELHKRGASLTAAKKRAAARYGISTSTVERMWIDRANIEEVDFASVKRLILDSLEDENESAILKRLPPQTC